MIHALDLETIRLKFRNNIYLPATKRLRQKKLKCKNFTIISNNCWAGTVYESYGIKKMSPTVGMFIMPKDYIKFVMNIHYYLDQQLEFIEPEDSKWKNELKDRKKWKKYPIGKLDDVELQMLHYQDKKTARSKWESRVKRVNWNKLIFKFNDQNGATKEDMEKWIQIPLDHKLTFVAKPDLKITNEIILIKQPRNSESGIKASKEPLGNSRYLNVTKIINELEP